MRDLLSGRTSRVREQALFALGGLLILVHTIDDTIALGEVDIAPTVITAIALAVAALYAVLPWIVVLIAALFVGITRLVGGVLHIVSLSDPNPGDYTGPFEAIGALCVLAVGVMVVRRRLAARRVSA